MKQRFESVSVEKCVVRPDNPQIMKDEEFNRLVRNIQEEGFLEPILVVDDKDHFEILSGAHRYEAAKVLGLSEVPAIILEEVPEERRIYLLVRMNAIKGQLDRYKFTDLVNKFLKDYEKSAWGELIDLFMVDKEEFERLYLDIKHSLPKEIQDMLPKTGEEIKNIENLAQILNRLFSQYGDTLELNFMIMDFGGKEHLWIKCEPDTWKYVKMFVDKCKTENLNMDIEIGKLIKANVE